MSLDYQVFDPATCRFPRPRVSVLPQDFERATRDDDELLREVGSLAGKGRISPVAVTLSAKRIGALVSMVGDVARPSLPLRDHARPCAGARCGRSSLPVECRSDTGSQRVGAPGRARCPADQGAAGDALFGFVRDFSWLKMWCDIHSIVLVEDCSHTLYTERYQAKGAGRAGRFVASSPYKFFPSADAGWLYAPGLATAAGNLTQPANWVAELRGVKQCLDAVRRPRVGPTDLAALDAQIAAMARDAGSR